MYLETMKTYSDGTACLLNIPRRNSSFNMHIYVVRKDWKCYKD